MKVNEYAPLLMEFSSQDINLPKKYPKLAVYPIGILPYAPLYQKKRQNIPFINLHPLSRFIPLSSFYINMNSFTLTTYQLKQKLERDQETKGVLRLHSFCESE